MKRIGERIKRKREILNLQLNDLARKVGISPSALSQIEKAKAFPSIITLKSIADNLHTSVGELIGENETLSNNPVVYSDEIRYVEKNDLGTEIYLLSHHDMNKQMDTYLVRFVRDSDLKGLFLSNIGQTFCYVVSGKLSFELDSKTYLLKSGDSIYFNSKVPYQAKNISSGKSDLLWVVSPPSF
jgi:transcriptional regulator with XRE-family HTH domain